MSKILLVDDDADLAELVQTKLSGEGNEVATVNTGEGAFERAKEIRPEIVILDIMLPGVTGYQICRRIRKDPELYNVAVLMLTALGEEPEIMHGLEQGADDCLTKPFKLDQLMEKLDGLKALQESIKRVNPVSQLPGTEAIKREINHRLSRGVPLAACYIDMVGYKPFGAVHGQEGQRRALEFMSQLLRKMTQTMGIYETYVSHLGGEHFVVVLNLEDYERFCNSLMETFDRMVKKLYTQEEQDRGYIVATSKSGKSGKYPLMALSIGVGHTQFRSYKSAKKLFEVLAQTRQKAVPQNGKSAVFVDQRKADR